MKINLPVFLLLTATCALSHAQNTERQRPQDDNPACMQRDVDSNSPGCVLNEPSSTRRVIARPPNQAGNSSEAAPGLKPAPAAGSSAGTPSNSNASSAMRQERVAPATRPGG